uniref:Zona pellucida sperm-binding protein 1/4 Ig-like domain-containing protein n=1 Tax=Denticeps clupeoides TaxID=299321 RepID=A0AAY4C0M8_9TELE
MRWRAVLWFLVTLTLNSLICYGSFLFSGEKVRHKNVSSWNTLASAKLRQTGSSVHCSGDSMMLRVKGSDAPHFMVERGERGEQPVQLSHLPAHCGFSMKRSRRDVVFLAPYDGCHVYQQAGRYVLPLQIWGTPFKMSCPIASQPTVSCLPSGMVVKLGRITAGAEWFLTLTLNNRELTFSCPSTATGLVYNPYYNWQYPVWNLPAPGKPTVTPTTTTTAATSPTTTTATPLPQNPAYPAYPPYQPLPYPVYYPQNWWHHRWHPRLHPRWNPMWSGPNVPKPVVGPTTTTTTTTSSTKSPPTMPAAQQPMYPPMPVYPPYLIPPYYGYGPNLPIVSGPVPSTVAPTTASTAAPQAPPYDPYPIPYYPYGFGPAGWFYAQSTTAAPAQTTVPSATTTTGPTTAPQNQIYPGKMPPQIPFPPYIWPPFVPWPQPPTAALTTAAPAVTLPATSAAPQNPPLLMPYQNPSAPIQQSGILPSQNCAILQKLFGQ